MRLLDDVVPLFLVFFLKDLHTATHSDAPIYISTKSVRGFPFPHTLSSIAICRLFPDGQADRYEMKPHSDFALHSLTVRLSTFSCACWLSVCLLLILSCVSLLALSLGSTQNVTTFHQLLCFHSVFISCKGLLVSTPASLQSVSDMTARWILWRDYVTSFLKYPQSSHLFHVYVL